MTLSWFGILALAACACTADLSRDLGAEHGAPALPPSLRDTEPDGALRVNAQGRFVADADAMRFFDYFLTAEDEVPADALRDLVYAHIRRDLPAPAADEAVEAFERYLLYREEAAAIMEDPAQTADTARNRLVRLHAELVPDIPGLARDPVLFHRAAALHHVLSDPDLDRRTRAARVTAIESDFEAGLAATAPTPADARARTRARLKTRQATRLPLRLRAAEQRLRAQGGSDADVHALRVAMVGPAAADRLARLDQARARWQQRVADYRATITVSAPPNRNDQATTPDPDQAIPGARAQGFSPRERLRLRAVMHIGHMGLRETSL